MKLTAFYLMYVLVLCLPIRTAAQIYRTNPDTVVKTFYSPADSIHIFNTKTEDPITGSLQAKSPGGVSADFTWSKYNSVTKAWDLMNGQTATNVTTHVLSNISTGGYKVNISTGPGINQEFIAWVFCRAVWLDKESSGEVPVFSSTCQALGLSVKFFPSNPRLIYFNPTTKVALELPNKIVYGWSTDKKNVEIYQADSLKKDVIFEKQRLPLDTTWFLVKVTDSYKLSRKDSAKYKPIISKAEFDTAKVEYLTQDKKYSAPVKIWFKNKSINSIKDTWNFDNGLDTNRVVRDTAMVFKISNRKYKVVLTTESDKGCIDTMSKVIEVAPAQIGEATDYDLPNVFTPNGDNENEYFIFKAVSIQNFRLTIYSRWGKKVYEYQGSGNNVLSGEWKGWDGRIGSSKPIPGMYYYVLEVKRLEEKPKNSSGDTGTDNKFRSDGIYKGFFYLFMGEPK